ncbi:Cell division inhibitor [Salmonella enterica subsp. enterica]|uniref:Cell division inhibitor n=1 Tax=Salmonella enterica I TaxID=59201 RepID=A0A447N729_SALET|nr:Cell division inhibitor [Salmonella enterica subsp. enterica]
MQILITGGTGLIGRHLIPRLLTLGHQVTVVTRNPDNARQILDSRVTLWKGLAEREHLNEIDAIINLAGEPIADKRWTSQQKERLCQKPLGYHAKVGGFNSCQRYAALGVDIRLRHGLLRRSGRRCRH